MYTTNCPNCNLEVSNQQPFCPRCGVAMTGNAPVGQPQNYQGQTGNQMQYPPAGQPGMEPMGQPGMAPAGQPGMAPMGQPGMAPMGQPGMPPAGPPGMAPAGVGGAENNNPGAGKLHLILIGIVGIIAVLALVFAIIGILPGQAEEVEEEEDTISLEDFSVENYKQTSEIIEYEYIEDTIRFMGDGEIAVSDKENSYFVAFKRTLVSGGGESSDKETYQIIIVENGSGKFSTYTSGDLSVTSEPKYEFEILGFTQLNK